MFSIGASITGHWTWRRGRALARRRVGAPTDAFRPMLELLEGRAMPSAAPMSLLAPLAPIASVRLLDAGAPVAITITIPIAFVTPADNGIVIERVFQETFRLQPFAESEASLSTVLSPLPSQAAIGRMTAPLVAEPAALSAIPPIAQATPASVIAASATAGAAQSASPASGLSTLPITQAPTAAIANFTTPETLAPVTAPPTPAPSATPATPLTSIDYFYGSDRKTDEEWDGPTMPPAEANPTLPDAPGVQAEFDRAIDTGAALSSDDTDAAADPVPASDAAAQDGVLTSDRSIALAAVSAGLGVSWGAVAVAEDTSRGRRLYRQRARMRG